MEQNFFFDEQPIQRFNNKLTPKQAINIVDDAIEHVKGNNKLSTDLKELKEWLISKT